MSLSALYYFITFKATNTTDSIHLIQAFSIKISNLNGDMGEKKQINVVNIIYSKCVNIKLNLNIANKCL